MSRLKRVCAGILAASSLAAAGCSKASPAQPYVPPAGFVTNTRVIYSDGLHNENTEMIGLDDRILLIFRGGEMSQTGSSLAHINVFASTDNGATFTKQSEVNASTLPGMRDIRDPKLVQIGNTVYLYAISRLPGGHYRDDGGQAWTIRAQSTDKGVTWADPVKTFSDVDASGTETFWGFWRYTKRDYTDASGATKETLYATGYDDGDTMVGFFASDDGVTWQKRAIIVNSPDDVPSETELHFFGANQGTAVAVVRMDNQGILQDGQSAICTSQDPFTTWECGRRIEQRLDGPSWITTTINGVERQFFVARKHLPCTRKRTAVYELKGDLTNPQAHIDVCEIEELPSAGDTAYTAVVPLGGQSFLTSWYSTSANVGDVSWLQGIYSPSDIWLANLDLSKASPTACHAPPAKTECPAGPLVTGKRTNLVSGEYFLSVAPVIYPSQVLTFQTKVTVHGNTMDVSLQPLVPMTGMPVGESWDMANVPIYDDGSFGVSFDQVPVPSGAFPLLADPFLQLHNVTFEGVASANGQLCGQLGGYAQVLGTSPADRIDLTGTTFGAALITGGKMPTPITACSAR